MKVSEQIKKRRQEMTLTQESVASELHVTRQTISSWENGRSYPDIEMLIQLSDFFDISLDQLLKGDTGMVEDMKEKTEIRESKRLFWGSWVISAALCLLFLLSSAHVKGFKLTLQQDIFLLTVVIANFIVLITASRKRTTLGLRPPIAKMQMKPAFTLCLAAVVAGVGFLPLVKEWRFTLWGAASGVALISAWCLYLQTKGGDDR